MRIEKYPLTNSYYIIVFEGKSNTKYSRGTSRSWIVENNTTVQIDFANARLDLEGYSMFGKILSKEEKDFQKIIKDSEYTSKESAKQTILNFLKNQGFEVTENTWMLFPKPPKKLTGKKIQIEFNLGNPEFNYGYDEIKELDVYMTPITNKSKSVSFSMMIPKHIYDMCSLDPDENLRPKYRYIESESLSYLHLHIKSLVNQAFNLNQREKEASKAKKVICINFSSSELSTRDSYNFGYTGNKISTVFNYYVCYFTGKEYYSYLKVDSGMGVGTTGTKCIIDYTKLGHKSWIKQTPSVVIDWTEEREGFLKRLENNFRKLSENLNEFLKDLNQEKLDFLIQNADNIKLLK